MATGAPVDDPAAHVQQFCAMVTQACSELLQATDALHSEADAARQLADTAHDRLLALGNELHDGHTAVHHAAAEAAAALEHLGQAADQGAGERVAGCEQDLAHAGSQVDTKLHAAGDTCEEGLRALEGGSLHDQVAAVEALRHAASELEHSDAAAFDGLEAAVQQALHDLEQAAAEVAHAISDATGAVEEHGSSLEQHLAEVTSHWHGAIDEALRQGCESTGAEVVQLYGNWSEGAASQAQALAGSTRTALAEVSEAMDADTTALRETVDALVSGAVQELSEEASLDAATLEAGAQAVEALQPTVPDLRIALGLAERMAEMVRHLDES